MSFTFKHGCVKPLCIFTKHIHTADLPDASTKIIQVSPVMSPLMLHLPLHGVGLESTSGSIIIVAAGLCSR